MILLKDSFIIIIIIIVIIIIIIIIVIIIIIDGCPYSNGLRFTFSQRAPLREAPPNDYRVLAIVSIFFCPLLGILSLIMSYVVGTIAYLFAP